MGCSRHEQLLALYVQLSVFLSRVQAPQGHSRTCPGLCFQSQSIGRGWQALSAWEKEGVSLLHPSFLSRSIHVQFFFVFSITPYSELALNKALRNVQMPSFRDKEDTEGPRGQGTLFVQGALANRWQGRHSSTRDGAQDPEFLWKSSEISHAMVFAYNSFLSKVFQHNKLQMQTVT